MSISQSVHTLENLIKETVQSCHRKEDSVLLLAVSKQQGIERIREAYYLGIKDFGESYVQEAYPKIVALRALPLCWHFIGTVQTNKAKMIAKNFAWVHSITHLKTALALSAHRPDALPPLQICLQIKLAEEPNKTGISKEEAKSVADALSKLPRLTLRGLMTIPPPQNNNQAQFQVFLQLSELLESLNKELGLQMDTLSMGMSDSLVPAIQAGATIVRIGRALFGERK